MKKSMVFASVLLGSSLLSQSAFAEQFAYSIFPGSSEFHERALTVNAVGLLSNGIDLTYHHLIDTGNSWQIGLVLYGGVLQDRFGTGFGVLGGYNWHFRGDDLRGFYAGPRVGLQTVTVRANDEFDSRAQSADLYLGGAGGYRWIWPKGWTFSAGAASYLRVHTNSSARALGYTQSIVPGGELSVGYAF